MEGDSDSAAIRPSTTAEAAPPPGSQGIESAVRFDCLKLAQHFLVAQSDTQDGDRVIELGKRFADFVLAGTLPVASPKK